MAAEVAAVVDAAQPELGACDDDLLLGTILEGNVSDAMPDGYMDTMASPPPDAAMVRRRVTRVCDSSSDAWNRCTWRTSTTDASPRLHWLLRTRPTPPLALVVVPMMTPTPQVAPLARPTLLATTMRPVTSRRSPPQTTRRPYPSLVHPGHRRARRTGSHDGHRCSTDI